jgi:hypothetical protein
MNKNMIQQAIKKAIANEWKDEKADVGTIEFRGKMVIDLDLTVSRGPDINAAVSSEIPWMSICIVALSRMGFQREAIEAKILELATAFLELKSEYTEDELAKFPEIKRAEILRLKKEKEELVEISEKAKESFKKNVTSKLPKKPKAAPTQIKGIVRIASIVPLGQEKNILEELLEEIKIVNGLGVVPVQEINRLNSTIFIKQ